MFSGLRKNRILTFNSPRTLLVFILWDSNEPKRMVGEMAWEWEIRHREGAFRKNRC